MPITRAAGRWRKADNRYKQYFDQTFQLAAVLEPDGMVSEINETMRAVGGLHDVAIGDVAIWNLPLWESGCVPRLQSGVATAANGDFFDDEISIIPAQGILPNIIVDLSIKPIRDAGGDVDFLILEARDITQHKADQQLLIQAQKMEILGQFASGMAHDFNNLLAVIGGNLELVERRLKGSEAERERLKKALTAVFEGRSLTDQILAFARKRQLAPSQTDLPSLVKEAVEFSRSGLAERTEVTVVMASGVWPCWADPVQLQSALLNLMMNASDAMPEGGGLVIKASNCPIRSGSRPYGVNLPEGDYVCLSVCDEGSGIPPHILARAIEPFFTTKELGRGSGLGLSMVQGFIQQSGGDLVIESEEGKGTEVFLYLPRARNFSKPQNDMEAFTGSGTKCVLVVDDESAGRDVAVTIFSGCGYKVREAENAQQAMEILRAKSDVDLLVTDITMPGEQDGMALGRFARNLAPDMRILYVSARSELKGSITNKGQEAFLTKPYHASELKRMAQSLLMQG